MTKYFPFGSSSFDLKMGTSPMKESDTIVEVDENYLAEIELKRSLLEQDHAYYFRSLPEAAAAEWDVVEKVIDDLVKLDPDNFSIQKNSTEWHWENNRLKENLTFSFGDNSSLPLSPLDWAGRQVQEDLIILNASGIVISGQLCFPSGWALDEKLGKQFMEVHAPLPSVVNPMIQAANKLLAHIPLHKPITRNNWALRLGNQLDSSSKHSLAYREKLIEEKPQLTIETVGEKIFLRVEHQTLTRLPRSGFILFTIRTFNSSLQEEASDPHRAQIMLSYLKTVPAELIKYKVIDSFYEKVIAYLTKVVND